MYQLAFVKWHLLNKIKQNKQTNPEGKALKTAAVKLAAADLYFKIKYK